MSIGLKLQAIYEAHINNMSLPVENYANSITPLSFPYINDAIFSEIMQISTNIFASEDILLQLEEPIFVVGDIHGHILDLYRIFQKNGLPPDRNYLFLGDIIDRGRHSFECLTLILIMKILYPKNIYLIRGNHEFLTKPTDCSFYSEITERYFTFDEVGNQIYQVFGYIPLAAKIGKILCIHGGLDPKCTHIKKIKELKRPLYYAQEPFEGLVWSDPKEDLDLDFLPSPRGHGYLFSKRAFDNFLAANKLELVIRGHEFIDGIQENFNKRLITVFSATSYVPGYTNKSGLIYLQDGKAHFILYPQIAEPPNEENKHVPLREYHNSTASMPKLDLITKPTHMPKHRKLRRLSLYPSSSSGTFALKA